MSKEYIFKVTLQDDCTPQEAEQFLRDCVDRRNRQYAPAIAATVTYLREARPVPPSPRPKRPGKTPAERPFEALVTEHHGYLTMDGRLIPETDHTYCVVVTPQGFCFRREVGRDYEPAFRFPWQETRWRPDPAALVQEITDNWLRSRPKGVHIVRNTLTAVKQWPPAQSEVKA